MTWEIKTLLYLFSVLVIYPVSADKPKLVDLLLILGAGYLLITGYLAQI